MVMVLKKINGNISSDDDIETVNFSQTKTKTRKVFRLYLFNTKTNMFLPFLWIKMKQKLYWKQLWNISKLYEYRRKKICEMK